MKKKQLKKHIETIGKMEANRLNLFVRSVHLADMHPTDKKKLLTACDDRHKVLKMVVSPIAVSDYCKGELS